MLSQSFDQYIQAVRRFNRFYTQKIGVLQEGLFESPFSLTELRVLYELAHSTQITAVELSRTLGLDPGYLSRILRRFSDEGWLTKAPSSVDGRQQLLWLTEQGRTLFAPLDLRSQQQIGELLAPLSATEQARLVEAMATIQRLLEPSLQPTTTLLLRAHKPGDMGWVVQCHALLYAQEYGWDERFEALVARIVADFIDHYDPKRERCWIAEKDGVAVGSVFVVKKSDSVAKLRLLVVKPEARGLGLGKRLVAECIDFARQTGYQQLTLWTNSVLVAARGIYEQAGFQLIHAEAHESFGQSLVGETWELTL